MMEPDSLRNLDNSKAIFAMWLNWTVAAGAPTAGLLLSKTVGAQWFPVILFILELVLYFQVRDNRDKRLPVCMLIPFVVTRILFWSAIVSLVLLFLASCGVYDRIFELYWEEWPYIPVMVVSPVAALVSGWVMMRRHSLGFCVDCRMRHGTSAERGFLGRLFSQEGWFQIRFMMWLAVVMTIISYVYYAIFYINAGISSSDSFFFIGLPAVLYVVSVLFMGVRYFNLWIYYGHYYFGAYIGRGASSGIRFLIFSHEKILLTAESESFGDYSGDGLLDTPAMLSFFFRRQVLLHEATRIFRDLSDINEFGIRFMYSSHTAGGEANMFHFIVTIDDPGLVEKSKLVGEWTDMATLSKLINSDRLTPMLAAEIYRLHSVTMAWKTYDRSGRRRYKIKNYRPTFRLEGIVGWDVDFNDPQWLYVATNNQDCRFYYIKRFWRRYINGIKE